MSTKTTFKRIALVTVAALGLSLVAVAPSQAVVVDLTCTVAGNIATSTTCSQNSGANNYVVLTAGSADIYITIAGGSIVGGGSSKVVTHDTSVAIATPIVGTITVTGYTFALGAQSATATDTVVITVTDAVATALTAARIAGTYYDHSTAFIKSSSLGSEATVDSTGITSIKDASATPVARVTVKQYSSTDATYFMTPLSAKLVTVAVVGGAGYVSTASNGTLSGPSASVTADESSDFYVYPNGNAGVASVTVTVNGVLLATKSVTFYGTATALTAAVATTVLKIGSNAAAVVVTAKDSLGNIVPNTHVYLVSDTAASIATGTSLGTTDSTGTLTAAISGVAAGLASLTFANGTDTAAVGYVVSGATAVRVSAATSSTATGVVLAFDKDSYLPGEVATVTATVTDASGAVPSGIGYVVLTAGITSSLVMTSGSLTLGAITTTITPTGNAGAQSFTVNMPLSAGTVTLSATGVTGVTVTNATAVVANDSTAADAAAEATDAANAATDAANAAAEAADAATAAAQDAADAVAALSAQVATLISGLKAQLTALTNLVIKIQKKVKA